MYSKNPYDVNPYGVPYNEMVEGAKFYDNYLGEWVTLSESYDSSMKGYWLGQSDEVDDEFMPLVHIDDLSYNDDLAYDMEDVDD